MCRATAAATSSVAPSVKRDVERRRRRGCRRRTSGRRASGRRRSWARRPRTVGSTCPSAARARTQCDRRPRVAELGVEVVVVVGPCDAPAAGRRGRGTSRGRRATGAPRRGSPRRARRRRRGPRRAAPEVERGARQREHVDPVDVDRVRGPTTCRKSAPSPHTIPATGCPYALREHVVVDVEPVLLDRRGERLVEEDAEVARGGVAGDGPPQRERCGEVRVLGRRLFVVPVVEHRRHRSPRSGRRRGRSCEGEGSGVGVVGVGDVFDEELDERRPARLRAEPVGSSAATVAAAHTK